MPRTEAAAGGGTRKASPAAAPTDEQLLAVNQGGNPEAFALLCERYGRFVREWLWVIARRQAIE